MALTRRFLAATFCVSLCAALVAAAPQEATKDALVANLSLDELDEQLQVRLATPCFFLNLFL